MKRYAMVYAEPKRVTAYLPDNYSVVGTATTDDTQGGVYGPGRTVTIIGGEDRAGWTLDAYVLPRLASGLYFGKEIDLSHPIMKVVPA